MRKWFKRSQVTIYMRKRSAKLAKEWNCRVMRFSENWMWMKAAASSECGGICPLRPHLQDLQFWMVLL